MNCITQQSYALVGISLGSLKGVMHWLLSLNKKKLHELLTLKK